MYKDLSSGVKGSITRSISSSFESYLASIGWDEDKFSLEDFVQDWQKHFMKNAAWVSKVPTEVLMSTEFHQEIAKKIDEVRNKILNEEPTQEQVDTIEQLQKQLGTAYTYECKAEAAYVEQLLKKQL